MSAHTLAELYETLTSGGKFRLRFNCRDEAVEFRSRLATYKYRIEKPLKDMAVIQHQILAMDYDIEENIATFFLREPDYERSNTTFEILEVIPPTPPTT